MKIGLVCMMKGKGMKKGFQGLNALKKLSKEDIGKKGEEASIYNINYTLDCLEWVKTNGKGLFRISSNLIPYYEFWDWKTKDILSGLEKISTFAADNDIRLIMHPDQFTVLNSENEKVVENSLLILEHHDEIGYLLGVRDIIIHTGSAKGNYKERFIENTSLLTDNLKKKILIENCHSVGIEEVLKICIATGLRPCLDFHHDRIKPSTLNIEEYIDKVLELSYPRVPLAHISSPEGLDKKSFKSHHEYISKEDLVKFEKYFYIFDMEIEAKGKEKAVKKVIDYFKI